ncbi:MAG: hypothetical protein ABSA69_11060 [Verrucomicrobiota bacterium]
MEGKEMNESEEKLKRSIELAKCGFENAQARITAIDTKVSIAVGLLIVLLPVPLAIASWLFGLEKDTATSIFTACSRCWFLSSLVGIFLFCGMLCAFFAILEGISCLTPRGPKGYGKRGPFQNEWRPNVLFPIYSPENAERFCRHLQQLQDGIELPFIVNEYDHQVQQLGSILDAKFAAMNRCFQWLNRCFALYGSSVLVAAIITLFAIERAH